MSPGTPAVIAGLAREFGPLSIEHGFDTNSQEVLLDFKSDGRDFKVRIMYEYDSDYDPGQIKVDLSPLCALLRGSPSVTTKGIQYVELSCPLKIGPAWSGHRVIELGSMVSADEVAEQLGEVLKRDARAFAVPRAGWAEAFEQFGAP